MRSLVSLLCPLLLYPAPHPLSCFVFSTTVLPARMFTSPKLLPSFKLKRNPRKTKWTKAFRKSAGKEMAIDSTFDFARRRDRVEKYDRNVMGEF